jgi:hypothetical protein
MGGLLLETLALLPRIVRDLSFLRRLKLLPED